MYTGVYKGLEGFTRVYGGLHGYTGVYMGKWTHTGVIGIIWDSWETIWWPAMNYMPENFFERRKSQLLCHFGVKRF